MLAALSENLSSVLRTHKAVYNNLECSRGSVSCFWPPQARDKAPGTHIYMKENRHTHRSQEVCSPINLPSEPNSLAQVLPMGKRVSPSREVLYAFNGSSTLSRIFLSFVYFITWICRGGDHIHHHTHVNIRGQLAGVGPVFCADSRGAGA